jgi:hypothetical protein
MRAMRTDPGAMRVDTSDMRGCVASLPRTGSMIDTITAEYVALVGLPLAAAPLLVHA